MVQAAAFQDDGYVKERRAKASSREREREKTNLERRVTGGRFDTGDRASHDKPVPANATVPLGANPLKLNVLETSFREPLNVLFLLGEKHPHICKEARKPEGWVDWANETCFPTYLENSVGFSNTPLRVRPVLNAVSKR